MWSSPGRGHRRGWLCHEPGHAGEVHPGDGLEAVHPRLHLRRRARASGSGVRRRRARVHGRAVHHRAVLPAVVAGDGPIVNKLGQAVRRRGLLPLAYVGFVLEQPDASAYLIVDCDHMEHPSFPLVPAHRRLRDDRGDGAALGLPDGSLVADARALQRVRRARRGPRFHKHPDWLAPQNTGPWGAFDLRSARRSTPASPSAACAPRVDGEVQREDGSVIPGLYAAGACASTSPRTGRATASGTQLGEGSSSGGGRAGTPPRRPQRRAGTPVNHLARSGASGGMRAMPTQEFDRTASRRAAAEVPHRRDLQRVPPGDPRAASRREPHAELKDINNSKIFDKKRMFSFKVGRRWVATCGDFARLLTVPGGAAVPTAGVTVVTVQPPYRRRGLLREDDGPPARAGGEARRAARRAVVVGVTDLRSGSATARRAAEPCSPARTAASHFLPGVRDVGLGRRGDPGADP